MKFADLPTNPDDRMLRQFAGLWVLFLGAIGAWEVYKGNTWGWPIFAVAVGVGVPGLAWPGLLKPIFVTWMVLAFPIGWLVSHVILALVFYGVFTPLGMLLKATGHDPLARKRGSKSSYWQTKTQQREMRRYLKQF